MPRRLIIGILVVLILGIVGGTIALIVPRLRAPEATTTPASSPGTLTPAQPGSQQVVNPTGDDDSDGLSNADEVTWGTVSTNPDTDGDGFKDGEEVAANHNPTIPSPNDKLPANFVPGQNVQPLAAAPLQVDQYFADNLDLSGGQANLTEAYRREYAEKDRTPDTLTAFVKQQPVVLALPRPEEAAINRSTDTPLVTAEYLEVAGDLSVFSNRTLLAEAIDGVFGSGETALMAGLAQSVRLHQQKLIEQPVPPAAENVHKLLLGYTQLVAATYQQMTVYNDDPVKAMVGVEQLKAIDARYFPLIKSELSRLQARQSG